MAQELFQKVAYIGLRSADGSLMLNVPLYVKVSELNKNGMTDTQEKVLHRISEIMIQRYEKQLSEYFVGLKRARTTRATTAWAVLINSRATQRATEQTKTPKTICCVRWKNWKRSSSMCGIPITEQRHRARARAIRTSWTRYILPFPNGCSIPTENCNVSKRNGTNTRRKI